MTITLYQHQRDDLEFLRAHDYAALWHEVGSGKTAPIVMRMLELLAQNPNKMFVVICEASILYQWEATIRSIQGDDSLNIKIVTGAMKQSLREAALFSNPDVLIVNYDFFPKIEDWLLLQVENRRLLGMIPDEAHRLKGFRGFRSKHGMRAKSIMKVAQFVKHRYAASGSPILNPNSVDLWGIYYFLSPKVMGDSVYRYENEFFYNVAQGQPYKKLILRPDMKAELSRRMYTCARRLLKSELPIDFPEITTIKYDVEMSPSLAQFYRDLAIRSVAEVKARSGEDFKILRPQILARLMALQQVASGFIRHKEPIPGGGEREVVIRLDTSHKERALLSILDEIGSTPTLVWAHFTHEIEYLQRMLREQGYSVCMVNGDVTGDDRTRAILSFAGHAIDGHAPGPNQILLGQPGAAGAGLNLQRAGHSIRWSRSYLLRDYEQSNGRNHRAGEQFFERITRHELVTRLTSDVKVYDSLLGKRDLASDITLDDLEAAARNAA